MEGYRLVHDVIACGDSLYAPKTIVVAERTYERFSGEFPDAVVISDRVFDKISDTINSQGILAISPIPQFDGKLKGKFCLYLDRIRDPGNLGTILRTAVACGFTDIILDDCVDVYNPKTIRSSMSAFTRCNFISAETFVFPKEMTLVYADMRGESISEVACSLRGKEVCLIIGSEADGVSERLRRQANVSVSLPMSDAIESLNAAVSASVIMYYLRYFNN